MYRFRGSASKNLGSARDMEWISILGFYLEFIMSLKAACRCRITMVTFLDFSRYTPDFSPLLWRRSAVLSYHGIWMKQKNRRKHFASLRSGGRGSSFNRKIHLWPLQVKIFQDSEFKVPINIAYPVPVLYVSCSSYTYRITAQKVLSAGLTSNL